LAAREMFPEEEMLEEDEEGDDEDEDDVDETSDDKTMDVQTDVSSGMGDASIPLEGTAAAAVEKEEHGDEHVIAEKLHNLTLDQEIQEASPVKLKMKSNLELEEVKSPKKSVASPLKEQSRSNSQALSKSHWRPWE
jgi:hypothetical protein